MAPDRGLSDHRTSGVKSKKNQLTYLFAVNSTGTKKRQPLIIRKSKKPRAFKKNFIYRNNPKVWMNISLYSEWLCDWDEEPRCHNRKIIYFHDNFSAHLSGTPDDLTQIRVENFRANLTAHVQPLNARIIRNFKGRYRRLFVERAVDRYDSGITPALIYEINQLEAMQIAAQAWDAVEPKTIANCWRKSGIQPDLSILITKDAEPAIRIEDLVSESLDALVAAGALKRANLMSIEMLLDPPGEHASIHEPITDKEIYAEVIKYESEANDIIVADDDDPDSEDGPSRCKALIAMAVLQRFTSTMDNPVARQLEGVIGKFGRQMRLEESKELVDTTITQFFSRK